MLLYGAAWLPPQHIPTFPSHWSSTNRQDLKCQNDAHVEYSQALLLREGTVNPSLMMPSPPQISSPDGDLQEGGQEQVHTLPSPQAQPGDEGQQTLPQRDLQCLTADDAVNVLESGDWVAANTTLPDSDSEAPEQEAPVTQHGGHDAPSAVQSQSQDNLWKNYTRSTLPSGGSPPSTSEAQTMLPSSQDQSDGIPRPGNKTPPSYEGKWTKRPDGGWQGVLSGESNSSTHTTDNPTLPPSTKGKGASKGHKGASSSLVVDAADRLEAEVEAARAATSDTSHTKATTRRHLDAADWQGDIIMGEDDAALPSNAVSTVQGPANMGGSDAPWPSEPGALQKYIDSEKTRIGLLVNQVGCNLWILPEEGEMTNDPTVYEFLQSFWNVEFTSKDRDTLHQRFKRTLRIIHPDKHQGSHPAIYEWVTSLTRSLYICKEAYDFRMKLLQEKQIPWPVADTRCLPNQELDDKFKLYLLEKKDWPGAPGLCHMLFSDTSSLHFEPYSSQYDIQDYVRERDVHAQQSFYNTLIGNPDELPLVEILDHFIFTRLEPFFDKCSFRDHEQDPFHICIFLSVAKADFCSWLGEQLKTLRALQFPLVITLLGVVDCMPTSWDGLRKYIDSVLWDERFYKTFINGVHLYNPPVFICTQAGVGPMKLLKRAFSVTLDTRMKTDISMGNSYDTLEVSWRLVDPLTALFQRSRKFYIDFPQEESGGAFQLASSIAKRFEGEFNGVASRSFGTGSGCRRKLFTIIFPPDFDADEVSSWKPYLGDLLSQLNICVVLGWEHMYDCSPGSYILTYDNSAPFHDMSFLKQIGDAVLVARNKAIIEIDEHHEDANSFGRWLEQFNVNSSKWHDPVKFKRLFSSDGRVLWRDITPAVSNYVPRRPNNLPPISESDIYLTMNGVHSSQYVYKAKTFCRAAAEILRNKGHGDFGDIGVWENSTERRNPPRLILTFPTLAASRAFYYTYNDYVWSSSDSSQYIILKLDNTIFQREFQDRSKRMAAACGVTPAIANDPELAGKNVLSLRDNDPSPPPAPGTASSSGSLLPRVPPPRPVRGYGGAEQ